MKKKEYSRVGHVSRTGRGEQAMVNVLGVILERRVSEADTDGAYSVFELQVPAGAMVPLHQHPSQETFYVLEGRIQFGRLGVSGAEWVDAGPGDTAEIPSGAMHGFRNQGDRPVRMLAVCTEGMEAVFIEAGLPVPSGAPLPASPPTQAEIERVVSIAVRHGQSFAPHEGSAAAA